MLLWLDRPKVYSVLSCTFDQFAICIKKRHYQKCSPVVLFSFVPSQNHMSWHLISHSHTTGRWWLVVTAKDRRGSVKWPSHAHIVLCPAVPCSSVGRDDDRTSRGGWKERETGSGQCAHSVLASHCDINVCSLR